MLFYVQDDQGRDIEGVYPPGHSSAGELCYAIKPSLAKHFISEKEAAAWVSGRPYSRLNNGSPEHGLRMDRRNFKVKTFDESAAVRGLATQLLPIAVPTTWQRRAPTSDNARWRPTMRAWRVADVDVPVMELAQFRMVSCAPRSWGVSTNFRIHDVCRSDDPNECGCLKEDLRIVNRNDLNVGKRWLPMSFIAFHNINGDVRFGWECTAIDWSKMIEVSDEW